MKLFGGIRFVPIVILVSLFLAGAASQNDKGRDVKKKEIKGDASKGKQLFEDNCSMCHEATDNEPPDYEGKVGPGLKGISKKGPDKLSDGTEHKDHSPEVLRKQVVEGGGTMPPVGASFSKEEVDDVIAYLQTL